MPEQSDAYDFLTARIASCLRLAEHAGQKRIDELDLCLADPFLGSRLRGAAEAVLAGNALSPEAALRWVRSCHRLGWSVSESVPFEDLAGVLGVDLHTLQPQSEPPQPTSAAETLQSCLSARAHPDFSGGSQSADYALSAALAYFTALRLLPDADDAAEQRAVLARTVPDADPRFRDLYAGITRALKDVDRRLHPINYTLRGRVIGYLTRRLMASARKYEDETSG